MRSTTSVSSALEVAARRAWVDRLVGRGSFIRRTTARRVSAVALVLVLFILFVAAFGPWISPHDPIEGNLYNTLQEPSREYVLGTDDIGRDILSRLIAGARVAVQVAFGAVGLSLTIGLAIGLLTGFKGGLVDDVLMRFIDAVMVFPSILFALAIVAVLGASLGNVILAIAVTSFPHPARLIRGQVLQVREFDYILAAHSVGLPEVRIALRHILPNTLAPLIVQATLSMGWAIIAEASLSFLGVGIQPPAASWGGMLRTSYAFLEIHPVWAISSGMAIFVTVLSINFLGDGIREALDPRMRGR